MRGALKKLALLQLLKNKNVITKTLKEVITTALGKSRKETRTVRNNSEEQQQRDL